MKKTPQVGLGILIFNKHNQLLLGERINGHGAKSYGPPGGHLEFGESFEDCAIRETKEETGITIISPKLIAITNDIFIEEDKHYISIFMKANYPENQQIVNLEPHKIIEWEWYSFKNLPNNLFMPLNQLIDKKGYNLDGVINNEQFETI